MATSRGTWKKRERGAAGFWGAKRNVLSGSSGRDDRTRSDSTHDRIFIETKLRENHAALTLWYGTDELARKEGKIPVLMLAEKGAEGFLVCIHSVDFPAACVEFLNHYAKEHPEILDGINWGESKDGTEA